MKIKKTENIKVKTSSKKVLKKTFFGLMQLTLSVCIAFFVITAPFTLLPNLLDAESKVNRAESYEYQGILELWHVETFEGGSVSRGALLEREAINFEKKHKGTYIIIKTMNLEQFDLNIKLGKKPNIISFGVGVGDSFVNELVDLDAENVRTDLCGFGKFASKQVAVPYILGGYAIINSNQEIENNKKNNSNLFGVGLKGATNPLKALQKNNMQISNFYNDTSLDSYDAYDKFLKGNFDVLLGTQRDVYRCYNRQQKGLLLNATFSFLGGYTDLVQYISVFRCKEIEQKLCTQFVSQIISKDTQQKLKDYNLFSTLKNTKLYDNGIYVEFENVLSNQLSSVSAFTNIQQLQSFKDESFNVTIKK